jgi:hypothetical protein
VTFEAAHDDGSEATEIRRTTGADGRASFTIVGPQQAATDTVTATIVRGSRDLPAGPVVGDEA